DAPGPPPRRRPGHLRPEQRHRTLHLHTLLSPEGASRPHDEGRSMYKGRRVAVVVPAFDEERFIAGVLSTMPAFVDRIVVVDDGSRDSTAGTAASLGDPRVTVLRAERNRGLGASMRLGYRAALEDGAELIAKMD